MDPKTNKSDDKLIEKLTELIEAIVTSGLKQLDESKVKEIKKICRVSDGYVTETFKLLMHQLSQKHSEIRLAAFNIVKELFSRSHCFRDLVTANFQDFTILVLDIDPKAPLPPPLQAAKQLRSLAVNTIKEWNRVYGEAYKKLRIGYNYLRDSKAVDFEDAEARSVQERRRIEERDAKLNAIKEAKLKQLQDELSSEESELLDCMTQMQNGFSLIVPDDFTQDPASEPDNDANEDLRVHGLTNAANFSLIVEVQPIRIRVNKDNREVIQCLQDQYRLLNTRFLPAVSKWNVTAAKLGADEQMQKRILDLKARIEILVQKYVELDLPKGKLTEEDDDNTSSADSDLETVAELDDDVGDDDLELPLNFDEPGPSGLCQPAPKKRRPLPESKLPVDIDSYQATQSNLPIPTFSSNPVESFWVQDLDKDGAAGAATLLTNPVALSENFQPVKWACRAPLPSGKLCPRQDRVKCPLHGPIVARDEQGQPKDPSSVKSPAKSAVPDWQEPSLLADIKAATGVDLTMPVKGKRVKKLQYPNLTDVKAQANTPRSRLEKKVLKKSSIRKVAETMNAIEAKKIQGKFGEQWNYS